MAFVLIDLSLRGGSGFEGEPAHLFTAALLKGISEKLEELEPVTEGDGAGIGHGIRSASEQVTEADGFT